ncbi:MAG: hypothetical protein ACFE8B_00950 [Candidatus Hermodarchaeota archaeon]
MTEYETFMVYELDDSGERNKMNILEEELQSNLHPEQVLVIVREDLRRIFIWKGPKSPVRKRFISSRVAQELQDELRKSASMHRCKIVSVDAGDEPTEFLNAFQLESMEVTERLADMRYIRNIERERMSEAVITDVKPKKTEIQEEEYISPALQDTSSNTVVSSFPKHPVVKAPGGLSKEEQEKIKEKILKTEISDNYKRLNLILGHTLLAAVSKVAQVFGDEVEETKWEAVKNVPNDMIELDNHVLRIYFNQEKGIVQAVEILEKKDQIKSTTKKGSVAKVTTESKSEQKSPLTPISAKPAPVISTPVNFSTMTVKDLKSYAEDRKIELPTNARKAEIIEILEKSKRNNPSSRRQLPKIPSNKD